MLAADDAITTIRTRFPQLVTQPGREHASDPVNLGVNIDHRGAETLLVSLNFEAGDLFPLWVAFLGLATTDVKAELLFADRDSRIELQYTDGDPVPEVVRVPGVLYGTRQVARGTWNGLRVEVADYQYLFVPGAAAAVTGVRPGFTDDWGLCTTCGGHGSVDGDEIPFEELRPRQQEAHAHGRRYHRSRPCPHCDGTDRVTSALESAAESAA